jgi:hypothetical protein
VGLGLPNQCEDWHPMKGPMTTQTLVGSIETGPLHWRADREGLFAFNPAFLGLMGDDEMLTDEEMTEFTEFVASLTPSPNPFRLIDNTLPSTFPGGGNPQTGETLYKVTKLDAGLITCNQCHLLPTGTNGTLTSDDLILDSQSMKIAQLRNMFEKTGLDHASSENTRGFGYTHDGAIDTLMTFLQFPGFNFTNNAQRQNVVAFLMCLSTDTHSGVGTQVTLASAQDVADNAGLIDQMTMLADANQVGLVVKGVVGGEQRGYAYAFSGFMQGDREDDILKLDDVLAGVLPGGEVTLTLVPEGAETRIGVDRDRDGWLDRDEIDVCSNPADGSLYPGSPGSIDVNADLNVNILDFVALQQAFVGGDAKGDFNQDGMLNILDFVHYQVAFVGCSQ